MKISIIMPVLNEGKILHKTLSSIEINTNIELIIVDGGSSDNTLEIAREFTDIIIISNRGRGIQLSKGAQRASGDILFFLHADAIPPKNFYELIVGAIHGLPLKNVIAGSFMLRIKSNGLAFRIIEAAVFIRSMLTSIPYGDQGLFMTKSVYQKIGGFNPYPLMEDIDIAKRLKKYGRIVFLRELMTVSPRRWLKEGIFYTTLRDWMIVVLYTIFNINPNRLIRRYKDVR